MTRPPLVVFDLDFTLWDAGGTWCDCLSPPFETQEGRVFDSRRREVRLYPDVEEIIDQLLADDHTIAIASRTGEPEWARELLKGLGIAGMFHHEEIYPGSKVEHFKRIAEASQRPYSEMVFFDDEERNIIEVGALGVRAVLVTSGVNHQLVEENTKT